MALEQRIGEIWYGKAPVPWWLAALVPVYRLLRMVHRAPWTLGLRKPVRLPVPVVVVGNLVAGGSGKTPLVVAMVEALRARGWKPGVVSRGHGGSEHGPVLLPAQASPAEVGDEACLIRRRTQGPVAIGRDRARAARLLLGEGVNVIVADDGLQNPGFERDVQICVIDGRRRFGNERLLPAGPLREPLARLAAFDLRVCNGGQAQDDEIPMRLEAAHAVPLDGGPSRPLETFAGQRVHGVAGIGDPQRFFDDLRARGIEVIEHPYPDHHAFTTHDLELGTQLPVFMTEKDAVKCLAFARAGQWCVPVRARLPEDFFDAVAARLHAAKGS